MENQKVNGFYDIVKLCKGGLTLIMPAFDASANDKTITMAYDVEKVRVPRAYALGIFTDSTLEKMYKNGYFTVEPQKAFNDDAAEIFAAVDEKVEVLSDKVVTDYLLKGNRLAIKNLIADGGTVNKQKILILARQHIGEISNSMVSDLEKILGIELTVEGENADNE